MSGAVMWGTPLAVRTMVAVRAPGPPAGAAGAAQPASWADQASAAARANAVRWAAPRIQKVDECPNAAALEPIKARDIQFAKVGILQGAEDLK